MGCFSFLCPCLPGANPKDTRAQKEAKEGLQEIVNGYRHIAKLDLPAGAASLIADVRRCVIELEKLLRDAKMPKSRQWLLPLPQEQADWESVYPKGGFLLRRQMCMASFGDGEWAVGCLFMSEFGIAFDTGHIPGETSFETGFLSWQDITSLTSAEPTSGKPKGLVSATVAGGRKFTALQLQLSIRADAEWLLEFWKRRQGGGMPPMGTQGVDEPWSVPDTDEGVHVPPPTLEARLLSPSASTHEAVVPETPARSKSIIMSMKTKKLSRRWSDDLSSGFAGEAGAEEPSEKPTTSEKYGQLSEEIVRKGLENDDCLVRFVTEQLKGYEMSDMPWVKSKRVNGTLVRKITFQMKLPDDVPKMVKRLVAIPESSSVTMLFRLRTEGNNTLLTYQTCTHDVTFGENFRVQETLAFVPVPAGGVELKRWAQVVWVAPLPWAMGAIKTYIEDKARKDGAASVAAIVKLAGELGG